MRTVGLYYHLKPWMPMGLRVMLRRFRVNRLRSTCGDVWPVNPAAAGAPTGWSGWPEGKQFALILTHDVESASGVRKVRELAGIEQRHGFRSSFNFIPEGFYDTPTELRHWLTDNGFEVGVHDLRHDGKLYSSREGFREKAGRINGYLKDWNAAGFRSGFMFHELDWIHDLNVIYDASTFDTDPFEPQPAGAGTIFPFWVPRSGAEGAIANSGSGKPEAGPWKPEVACSQSQIRNPNSQIDGSQSPIGNPRSQIGQQIADNGESLSEFSGPQSKISNPNSPIAGPQSPIGNSQSQGGQRIADGGEWLSEFGGPQSKISNPKSQIGSGYVELPYTLPQDSTLFVYMREKTDRIWREKLEWVAEHGGMALVNAHPDYMSFKPGTRHWQRYSAGLYEGFLEWVRNRWGDRCWHVLPRDLATWWTG
ncbi:MAG: hypothetical protein ACYDC1_25340 [Limisphaerales bacterium]